MPFTSRQSIINRTRRNHTSLAYKYLHLLCPILYIVHCACILHMCVDSLPWLENAIVACDHCVYQSIISHFSCKERFLSAVSILFVIIIIYYHRINKHIKYFCMLQAEIFSFSWFFVYLFFCF